MHGLSDNVSYCILRGWRSVPIALQPEAISDFLLLVLSLQCHSLPPGVYSTVLNITDSLRYSNLIRDTFWLPFAVSLYEAGCHENFNLLVFQCVNLQGI